MPDLNDWLSLEGVATPEEWAAAIAIDADGERIQESLEDECEMGSCCWAISEVRDLLAKGMLDKGLTRKEAQSILHTLNYGLHIDFLADKIVADTALGRIFRALELDVYYSEIWPQDSSSS